jgi:peptide/nickel transport system permease protein
MGLSSTASMIRVMRSNLMDELHKPYVPAARARGLAATRLILKYPLRLALNPFVSTAGYLLPQIVSGNAVISVVLSLPTIGPVLVDALLTQDMYLAGALVLLLSTLTVVGTFLSDLLLLWIDPRVRE